MQADWQTFLQAARSRRCQRSEKLQKTGEKPPEMYFDIVKKLATRLAAGGRYRDRKSTLLATV